MTYAQPIKYAPEPEHPDYYAAPEIEDDEITEKAIELISKNYLLQHEIADECYEQVIEIAGHNKRCLFQLEKELLTGKHNHNFIYMLNAYLEGLAKTSKRLREYAKEALEQERKENEEAFLVERLAA